jgi:aspartyl-tRNA(Asn)/glutamyl-tRNA(Gln) amidotransferase subunit A
VGRRVPALRRGRLAIGRLDDLFESADPEVADPAARALDALAGRHLVTGTRLEWSAPGLGRLFAAELHRTWGARIEAEPARFTTEVRASAGRGATVDDDRLSDVANGLRRVRRQLRHRLGAFDVVASPTVPHATPAAGGEAVDACTRFTRPFNALGWPAISIPCGVDGRGLPVGLQLAAPPGRLPALLRAAAAVEAAAGAVR